jgi:hypothetical protein
MDGLLRAAGVWNGHQTNTTWQGMQMVAHAYRQLARGKVTLVLVGGGAGIGKTWELRATCRLALIKHVPEERPENDSALIQCVWINRDCEVLAHNECDHLLQNPRSMNVIKLLHEEPRMCALMTKEAEQNQFFKDRRAFNITQRSRPRSSTSESSAGRRSP